MNDYPRRCVVCEVELAPYSGRGGPRKLCDRHRRPRGIRAERFALGIAAGRPREPGVAYADHLAAIRRELGLK